MKKLMGRFFIAYKRKFDCLKIKFMVKFYIVTLTKMTQAGLNVWSCSGHMNKEKQADGIRTAYTWHVETVCLLSNRKSKPDSYVDLSINMEDYHRIKNEEK